MFNYLFFFPFSKNIVLFTGYGDTIMTKFIPNILGHVHESFSPSSPLRPTGVSNWQLLYPFLLPQSMFLWSTMVIVSLVIMITLLLTCSIVCLCSIFWDPLRQFSSDPQLKLSLTSYANTYFLSILLAYCTIHLKTFIPAIRLQDSREMEILSLCYFLIYWYTADLIPLTL